MRYYKEEAEHGPETAVGKGCLHMREEEYCSEKRGYLDREFRLFHLTEPMEERISYHYHDFYKIFIFLRGTAGYAVEGRSYQLEPWDVVLIGHHVFHRPLPEPGAEYERLILYLSPDYLEQFRREDCDLTLCFQAAREHHSDVMRLSSPALRSLQDSLNRLERACQSEGYAKELYCRTLLLEFLIQLNQTAAGNRLEYALTRPADKKILEIMRYISENPAENHTIDGLASRFFMSKYHMMRLFKQETGQTILGFITEKRLLTAQELLRSGAPVTQVCYQCGFHNYAAFLRAYKKTFGETPKAGKV